MLNVALPISYGVMHIAALRSPHTRGWQSPQFCEYPQELGLAWEAPARVTQVGIFIFTVLRSIMLWYLLRIIHGWAGK